MRFLKRIYNAVFTEITVVERVVMAAVVVAVTAVGLLYFLCYAVFLLVGDYRIQLPYEYRLVRVYEGAVLLAGPNNEVLVDPNIDSYRIAGSLLIGRRSKLVGVHDPESPHIGGIYGYFIVDLKSGELKEGLSEGELLEALDERGVAEVPELKEPSRFDRFLRAEELRGPN